MKTLNEILTPLGYLGFWSTATWNAPEGWKMVTWGVCGLIALIAFNLHNHLEVLKEVLTELKKGK